MNPSHKSIKAVILLVEDDPNLGVILKDFLEMENYQVVLEKNGIDGLARVQSSSFDLCILDVMMPKMDGFTLAAKIKRITPETAFIFLTARNLEADRIKGLSMGADDYITKPFSTEELKLRIEIILKRLGKNQVPIDDQIYEIGSLIFDFDNQSLKIHGKEKRLTKKEALLLRLLCQKKNREVRREEALIDIWGSDDYFMGRSMDVYITKLRSYLKADPNVSIQNIHGSGFELDVKEHE